MAKIVFTDKEQIRDYAAKHTDLDAPFSQLSLADRTHRNMWHIASDLVGEPPRSLADVKADALGCAEVSKSATRERIYHWYADRIQPQEEVHP